MPLTLIRLIVAAVTITALISHIAGCSSGSSFDEQGSLLTATNSYEMNDFHEFSPTGGGDLPDIPTAFTFDYAAFGLNDDSVSVKDTLYYFHQEEDSVSAYVIIVGTGGQDSLEHIVEAFPQVPPKFGYFTYEWWESSGSQQGIGSEYRFMTYDLYDVPFSIRLRILYYPSAGTQPSKDKFYRTFVFIRER